MLILSLTTVIRPKLSRSAISERMTAYIILYFRDSIISLDTRKCWYIHDGHFSPIITSICLLTTCKDTFFSNTPHDFHVFFASKQYFSMKKMGKGKEKHRMCQVDTSETKSFINEGFSPFPSCISPFVC